MRVYITLILLSFLSFKPVQADEPKYGNRLDCVRKLYDRLGFAKNSTWPPVFEEKLTFIPFSGNGLPSYDEGHEKFKNEKNSPERDQALSSWFFLFTNDSVRSLRYPTLHGIDLSAVIRYKIDGKIYFATIGDIIKDFVDEKGTYSVESYQTHRKYLKNHPDAIKEANGLDYFFEALPITDAEFLKVAESDLDRTISSNVNSLFEQMKKKVLTLSKEAENATSSIGEPYTTEELSLLNQCATEDVSARFEKETKRHMIRIHKVNDYFSKKPISPPVPEPGSDY